VELVDLPVLHQALPVEVTPEVLPLEAVVRVVPEVAVHLPAEPYPASSVPVPFVSSGTNALVRPDKTVLDLLYLNVEQPEA